MRLAGSLGVLPGETQLKIARHCYALEENQRLAATVAHISSTSLNS
jgi:hypothetical protein